MKALTDEGDKAAAKALYLAQHPSSVWYAGTGSVGGGG